MMDIAWLEHKPSIHIKKRAVRLSQKKKHIAKQTHLHQLYRETKDEHVEPHRFHKVKALNCGDPKCMLCCNPRKYGELTMQERRFLDHDWIRDI